MLASGTCRVAMSVISLGFGPRYESWGLELLLSCVQAPELTSGILVRKNNTFTMWLIALIYRTLVRVY
jgi:hypothetical protein